MRQKIFFIAIAFLSICLTGSKCEKDRPDFNGLPPATQEGKNTLGFLLNGEPWTPKGMRVTGNISIDYDENYNQGIFSIVAYNFLKPDAEQFIIGITDSLNFLNAPIKLKLTRNSLYSISFNTPCDYFNQLGNVNSFGELNLTRLDRLNRVISGTFSATLSKEGCDEIKITEGRFDMKY